MNQTAGAILRRKVSAIQTRGYSFPIQSELAVTLEHAAARGATSALRVTTEAIVEHSRAGRLSTLIDVLPMPGLLVLLEVGALFPLTDVALDDVVLEPLSEVLAAEVAVEATGEAAHG